MKTQTATLKTRNAESGFITLDFIFAIGLAFGFSMIFFAMSFTLSMVEVCQYITFSSARAYNGAGVSLAAQEELGKQKYEELKNLPAIKPLLKNGWITLGEITLSNFNDDYEDPAAGADKIFVGARVPFKANVLNMRLPFLGNTAQDSSTGSATLNAYLMREVSTDECYRNFTTQRLNQLKQVDGRYGQVGASQEAFITDNGC